MKNKIQGGIDIIVMVLCCAFLLYFATCLDGVRKRERASKHVVPSVEEYLLRQR